MNPYSGADFFSFLGLFIKRLGLFVTGALSFKDCATDEIQILVLALVAVSSALVGTFLVLKKMAMLANSLSHTVLVGIVAAYLIALPFSSGIAILSIQTFLLAALLTGFLTTLLTQFLTGVLKLQEDASIGLVFSTLFALGVVLVTLFTRNTHLGVEAIMGNVDALHPDDVRLILGITCGNLLCLLLFYKEFKITAFDASLARSLGISPAIFNYILMVQASATTIGAFRSVGVLLVLAFLVGPVLTARLFTVRLGPLLVLAAFIGSMCSILGVALSRHVFTMNKIPLSTGGLVVTIIALVYLLSLMVSYRIRKKIEKI